MEPVIYRAPYPYAGGAPPDPAARGPAWAAPAAARPAPPYPSPPYADQRAAAGHAFQPPASPARARAAVQRPAGPGLFRRLVSLVFTLITVVLVLGGAGLVGLALLAREGVSPIADEDLPVTLPVQPIAIPDRTPLVGKPDKVGETAWTSGTCGDFSKERDLPAYQAGRSSGSAGALRGRTAALVLKLHSPSMVWTKSAELTVERAALMAQRFYLTQATAHGVTDLRFDLIPWGLRTNYQMPSLNLEANQRLPSKTMDLIRESSRASIEAALGAKLDRVIQELRRDGYQNVALFVFFPVKTKARNFAVPSYRSAPNDYPEAAYLFAPSSDFGQFAVTLAHEGMHLFGADDLYRIKNVDKRDDDDIMGEYCTGFLRAKVNDATSFAVGWRPAAPVRGYKFDVK